MGFKDALSSVGKDIEVDAIPVGASIGVAAFFGILIGCLFGLLPFARIGHKKSDEE